MTLIHFCIEIFSSLYPPFYRTVVRRSVFRAFGYYLFFTTIYSLAIGGVGLWWVSGHWEPTLALLETKLPPFELRISEGLFSTNLPEPVVVGDKSFTLIVDTAGRPHDLASYESGIVLMKTKAVFKKSKFETREYSFSGFPDLKVTTADAIGWLKSYKTPLLWGVFGSVALVVLPMVWLFLIPPILLFALLLLIPAAIVRSHLNYGHVLSIAYYAITFPTLLQTYLVCRGQTLSGTYWWGVYLVWCLIAIIAARGGDNPTAEGLEQSTQEAPPHQA